MGQTRAVNGTMEKIDMATKTQAKPIDKLRGKVAYNPSLGGYEANITEPKRT
jgi:hypothetical protein